MGGPYYVRSTDGDDGDNGLSWANAKATLAGAFAAASAGDTIYVSDNHAESQTAVMTLTSPGTAVAPCKVLCVDDSAEPPTALATTATISTSTDSGAYINFAGFAYYYGISFRAGVGASATRNITFISATPWWMRFDSCALEIATTGTSSVIIIGYNSSNADDDALELHNTTMSFGAAGQTINIVGTLRWTGTASAIGGTAPTTLFTPLGGLPANVNIEGVDLSAIGSGKNLVSVAAAAPHRFRFNNCKLGASVTACKGTNPGQGGTVVEVVNCDSADTNYRYQKSCYQGDIFHESTIVRTGGASDGTTPISRKMVSSANAKFFSPLESAPIAIWNETTGSSVTATVEVVTDNVTLTDAEAWLEVEYLGTSGVPLSSFASDRAANILATPANQTTSSVTWTTTGLSTPVKQKLSVAFVPQEKGTIVVRVMLAKASTTMYFCPKVEFGATSVSTRQYQASCLYVNEPLQPAIADVESGVNYGAGGTEFTGTLEAGGIDPSAIVAAQYVLTGHDNYTGGSAGTLTLPAEADVWHTATAYGVGGSGSTPTKVASSITNCSAGNVKKDVAIDDVTGTYDPMAAAVFPAAANVSTVETAYGPTGAEYAGSLNLSLYTLISGVVSADYVVTGHDNYTGGSAGTYPTTATSYAAGEAAQLAADQAAVGAVASSISTDVQNLLGTVDGTLEVPTDEEIAAAAWAYASRTLTE